MNRNILFDFARDVLKFYKKSFTDGKLKFMQIVFCALKRYFSNKNQDNPIIISISSQ